MKFSLYSLLSLLLTLQLVEYSAQAANNSCEANDISEIKRPLDPLKKTSKTFNYKFRIIKGTDINLPTIVYLNGGPGLPSIGSSLPRVPNLFTVIQTDIRGVGCNADLNIPSSSFTTKNNAADIIAIIKHLKLSNYIIYGLSYGTVLATVTTHQLESIGYTQPKAVVLEGILGKFFETGSVYLEFINQWNLIKTQLNFEALAELAKDNPLGHTPAAWGAFLSNTLIYGTLPDHGSLLINYLNSFNTVPAIRTFLEEQLQKNEIHVVEPSIEKVYKAISCSEFADDLSGTDVYFKLVNANVVVEKNLFCENYKLTSAFDSKNFQIKAPIYYFEGDQDPATPVSSAVYHFNNQKKSLQKVFILVKNGGHGALSLNLSDCKDAIWKEVVEVNPNLTEALKKCQLETSSDIK